MAKKPGCHLHSTALHPSRPDPAWQGSVHPPPPYPPAMPEATAPREGTRSLNTYLLVDFQAGDAAQRDEARLGLCHEGRADLGHALHDVHAHLRTQWRSVHGSSAEGQDAGSVDGRPCASRLLYVLVLAGQADCRGGIGSPQELATYPPQPGLMQMKCTGTAQPTILWLISHLPAAPLPPPIPSLESEQARSSLHCRAHHNGVLGIEDAGGQDAQGAGKDGLRGEKTHA